MDEAFSPMHYFNFMNKCCIIDMVVYMCVCITDMLIHVCNARRDNIYLIVQKCINHLQ